MSLIAPWHAAGTHVALVRSRELGKSSGGRTVLIVDDDPIVAEIYRIALDRGGYDVAIAKDGPTGIQMAALLRPALIFLDIRMPRMDGLEALAMLMAGDATRGIPVVMLSNFDDRLLVARSLELGAKEYIVKINIRPTDLVGVVERWSRPAG